jgi:hypothetical protein
LKRYNPVTAPFLYEMRIRLFRRERYESRGRRTEVGGRRVGFWMVAYRENLILERYFGETLRGSGYRWSEDRKREIEGWVDLGGEYESPVSKELFTRFTERGVWLGIGGVLGFLVLVNVVLRVLLSGVGGRRSEGWVDE